MRYFNYIIVFCVAVLFFGCSNQDESYKKQPIESWGFKKVDIDKAIKWSKNDEFYSDVPAPDCTNINPGNKFMCGRKDFQEIAHLTRQMSIYAEENATKMELDHKTARADLYNINCPDPKCFGDKLKDNFYLAMEESGVENY